MSIGTRARTCEYVRLKFFVSDERVRETTFKGNISTHQYELLFNIMIA